MKRKILTAITAGLTIVSSATSFAEDLKLEIFGPNSGQVNAGETFYYEYNIRNLGPGISEDVTLRDLLPDEVEYVDSLVDLEGNQGYVKPGCGVFGDNILWCPLGDIEPTGTVPIFVFVTLRVKPNIANGTLIINDADISLHDTPDPTPQNNRDSIELTGIAQRQVSP